MIFDAGEIYDTCHDEDASLAYEGLRRTWLALQCKVPLGHRGGHRGKMLEPVSWWNWGSQFSRLVCAGGPSAINSCGLSSALPESGE